MTPPLLEAAPDWLDVSRETVERLQRFGDLVRKWNPAINLVSKADVDLLWQRHILDSAQLFEFAPDKASRWADLGSGGGFPGIVIAILAREKNPGLEVHLVEADRRKAAFLAQAIRLLDLPTVLHVARIEALAGLGADIVSARAVALLPVLCGHAIRHLAPGGMALFQKGEAAEAEVASCQGIWQMDVARAPSRTGAAGVILKIRNLQHV